MHLISHDPQMSIEELKRLVAQGEGQTLEFKKKIAYPEKVVRELIAFANSKGGILVVGVDDDGSFTGQRFIEEEAFVLDKAIETYIRPRLSYTKEILMFNAKKGFAVYHIPSGTKKPYYLVEADGQKQAYIRVADRSIQASRETREIIRRQSSQKGVKIIYGDIENALMKYLAAEPFITISEFRRIAKIKRFVASNTLVRMVLAGILEIKPDEREDRFYPTA